MTYSAVLTSTVAVIGSVLVWTTDLVRGLIVTSRTRQPDEHRRWQRNLRVKWWCDMRASDGSSCPHEHCVTWTAASVRTDSSARRLENIDHQVDVVRKDCRRCPVPLQRYSTNVSPSTFFRRRHGCPRTLVLVQCQLFAQLQSLFDICSCLNISNGADHGHLVRVTLL